jgi:glycerol-3-phosphate acyltransferase PlsX
MKIGLDAMGGDYAPESTVSGALLALDQLPDDCKILLIGDREMIQELLARKKRDPDTFEILHTTENIEMGDHPAKAFAQKQDSSIVVGYRMLQAGKIDGFASAGNTGAMLVGSGYTVKVIPGIIRPTIASVVPTLSGRATILLDVGLNPDSRPDVLYQYAILGSQYAEHVLNVDNPRIGLLNIGEEETKGNLVVKSTHELMKGSGDFNFIGNVEGIDLFNDDKVDVIVCDGFVGNVVLKSIEAFYTMMKKRKIEDPFLEQFNFENYGGTPILGINANVIIGHGISNDIAVMNMIQQTKKVIHANLVERIKGFFT